MMRGGAEGDRLTWVLRGWVAIEEELLLQTPCTLQKLAVSGRRSECDDLCACTRIVASSIDEITSAPGLSPPLQDPPSLSAEPTQHPLKLRLTLTQRSAQLSEPTEAGREPRPQLTATPSLT